MPTPIITFQADILYEFSEDLEGKIQFNSKKAVKCQM
jgi:hypothetical protein